MLQLKDITKEYKLGAGMVVNALKGVSINFRKNEFVSILGPSGCGKTTMLNIIGGLDKYTSGDLIINDRSTKNFKGRDWDVYRNHRIGFIFQAYNLIPHQTVLANVELALTIAGIGKKERAERAKQALDKVGLSDQYNKKPNQLSGGQCQRVAIARALVNDPEILLADEPTGALDSKTSVQIMELVKEIAKERLVIMVTHNPELAEEYSTRIIKLKDGLKEEDSNPYSDEDLAKNIGNVENVDILTNVHASASVAENSENSQIVASDAEQEPIEILHSSKGLKAPQEKAKKERAKMSFFTAFKLSLNNLLTKKARTIMIAIAGSIGIIGVSLVLAVSWGMMGFIGNMQEDMLAGSPITISESAFNINALMQGGGGGAASAFRILAQDGSISVNPTVEALIRQTADMEDIFVQNEITRDYVDYLLYFYRNTDHLAAMFTDYGLNLANNIFADFTPSATMRTDATTQNLSLSAIRAIYASVLGASDFDQFAPFIATLEDPFRQLPDNEEYLMNQYTLLEGGRWAENENELMLVVQRPARYRYRDEETGEWGDFMRDENGNILNSGPRLSDLFLAQTGFFTQNEFMDLVFQSTAELDTHNPDHVTNLDKFHFEIDELKERTFTFYPSSTIFRNQMMMSPNVGNSPVMHVGPNPEFSDLADFMVDLGINPADILDNFDTVLSSLTPAQMAELWSILDMDNAFELIADSSNLSVTDRATGIQMNIVGILEPRPDINFTSLSAGFFYTQALRDRIFEMEYENQSDIVNRLTALGGSMSSRIMAPGGMNPMPATLAMGTVFQFEYSFPWFLGADQNTPARVTNSVSSVGNINAMAAMIGALNLPGEVGDMMEAAMGGSNLSIRQLAGRNNQGLTVPSSISLFSQEFSSKEYVLEHLRAWNNPGYISFERPLDDGTYETITLSYDERTEMMYTDMLSLIFGMVNDLIFIITVALIAFMSLSLVVSTVMIAIITYVSVVERKKEIGVIRSLGGRRLDVAFLFNAETFMIGLIAGLIGIIVTYLGVLFINFVVGMFQAGLVIASFPWFFAMLMVGVSIFLTFISGLLPSRSAAKKDPVVALRSE